MKKKAKQVILVTGASGMLGAALTHYLSDKGFFVIAQYRTHSERVPKSPRITPWLVDLSEDDLLTSSQALFKEIDTIIHCAAMTEVNQCEIDKKACREANVVSTLRIVDMAEYYSAKLVFISTPMVFSGKRGNYNEGSRISPQNYYGETKALAERKVLHYSKGVVVRLNPIGLRAAAAHPSFIQWFVQQFQNNNSFHLFKDVWINPIAVSTSVKCIFEIMQRYAHGVFHVGSYDIVNKSEIAKMIASYFPNYSGMMRTVAVNESVFGKKAARPRQMWLSVEKIQKMGILMPSWKGEVKKILKELDLVR